MFVTPAIAAAMHAAQQVVGVTIVYSRDESESIEDLPARVGRTMYEKDNGSGVIVKMQTRDYIVEAAKLILGGETFLPERGHKIVEQVGDQQFIYEVTTLDQNAWKYSDPDRSYLRIHTQHVNIEEA